MANNNTSLMTVANTITTAVESKVKQMLEEKRLDLPADFSASNALKAAQLAITQCEDKNHRPALEVCTKESIMQTLLSMTVQGLSPDKTQCYFICYGNKLTLFRSFYGDIAVAKRVDENIADIVANAVYKSEKDGFKMITLPNGKHLVTQHEADIFGSRTLDDMVGAYCTVTYKDGTAWSEFRNKDQILNAWKHSSIKPVDEKGNVKEGSTHAKDFEDMARRTVIRRACKQIINSSSDANIVAKYARETQLDMERAEAEQRIEDNVATGDIVDISDDDGVVMEVRDTESFAPNPSTPTNATPDTQTAPEVAATEIAPLAEDAESPLMDMENPFA